MPNYSASQDRVYSSQTQEQDLAGKPVIKCSIDVILSRSILAARLLICDINEAENVVMEAIDIWEPDEENVEQVFQIALRAAVRRQIALFPAGLSEGDATDGKLPVELRRVLKLPPELRRSFVLRVLVGLPSQVCAQMLEVGAREISEYCWAAMKRLSAPDP